MDARQPDGLAPLVMRQRWSDLLFLHWRFPVETIRKTLPEGLGLEVDTFDNSAWVGVVPFRMQRVRPKGLPPLPWLSWFLELNVRTYVIGPDGRPGVWFYSLDANQPVAVTVARRWFHLPYEYASMRAHRRGSFTHYRCRRRNVGTAAIYSYQPQPQPLASQPGNVEFFLVERYYLFAHDQRQQTLLRGQVHHRPYQLTSVDCARWSTLPLEWDGLRQSAIDRVPDHACYSAMVDVDIFGTRRVESSSRSA